MKSELTDQPKDVDSDSKDLNIEESKCADGGLTTVSEIPSNDPPGVQFSRKFRPWVLQALPSSSCRKNFSIFLSRYCDNLTSSELLSLTEALLRDIFRFQDRAYNKNEVKARSQRRFVVGFKESMRQLDIGKVKLLLIAPDLETG